MDINSPDPFEGQPVEFKFDQDDPNLVIEVNSKRVIPMAVGNRFWAAVQKWVAQGNTIRPATTFAQRKSRKVGQIDELRRRKLAQLTVTVAGKVLPATSERAAFVAVVQAAVNAGQGLPAGFSVRTTTGEKINLNESQLTTYCGKIATAQNALEQDLWARYDAIQTAADDTELDAVDVTK